MNTNENVVARKLFVALKRDIFYKGHYIITVDGWGNGDGVWANSDEEAREWFFNEYCK